MKGTYRITQRARQDLRDIGRYTLNVWGRKQRDNYLYAMERRFEWLAQNPQLGCHRPDVREEYFSYPQGSHVVFYLKRKNGIDIIGIPHQHMDTITILSVLPFR